MNGYIVRDIATGSVVAKYQGGNQSTDDILIANDFDKDKFDCVSFEIEDGYDINHYDEVTLKLKKDAVSNLASDKLDSLMKENKITFDILLNEINELRKLLNFPDRSKTDILDFLKRS